MHKTYPTPGGLNIVGRRFLSPRGTSRLLVALLLPLSLALVSCRRSGEKRVSSLFGQTAQADLSAFSLSDILSSGELIVGTLSGPDTYFTYRGGAFGLQYELAQDFARTLGTRLRVEVAHDTLQLLSWLDSGEVDMLALPLPESDGTLASAPGWLVPQRSAELAAAVDSWYRPDLLSRLERQRAERRKAPAVKRKARPQMLNAGKGIISRYDALFQQYAATIGWDWRLLAAQCWQESAFDPRALSWAGARGLMQIMPSTGAQLGLANPWDPEQNIAAAVKYLALLEERFSDIREPRERVSFILAAYNGGSGHVRDAMALAKEHGANPARWRDVEPYILLLQQPRYYTASCVKHGYMIGSETASYVSSIQQRWRQYTGQVRWHEPPRSSSNRKVNVRPRSSFMPDSL